MPAQKVYHFFKKRRGLLLSLMLLLSLAMLYLSSGIKLEEDITRFLPEDENSRKTSEALRELKVKDKIVVNIFHSDSTNTVVDTLRSCADELAAQLMAAHADYIADLKYNIPDEFMAELYAQFYENLPLFLEASDYKRIDGMIGDDSVRIALKNNYNTLLSPGGMVLGRYIQKDPLFFTPLALKKTERLQIDEQLTVQDGYIQTRDQKNLLMFISPVPASGDYSANKKFISGLAEAINKCELSHPGTKIEYYGAAPVSLGNSEQIRKDTFATSLIALGLIILLLFAYFKDLRIIFFILLPVIFGVLFSLSLLALIKSEISVIAIGAGSIVLGLAINYSLHFFTHHKHQKDASVVLGDLFIPMLIGCITTVAAFISLQFTKSTALHDFGLFSGFSLIGAMLFSVLVLPHLLKNNKENVGIGQKTIFPEKIFAYRLSSSKPIVFMVFMLTIVFAFLAGKVEFEKDMMKMNYQDEKLTKAQQNLEKITKNSLRSIYVVSRNQNEEMALQQSEQALAKLTALKTKGLVTDFSSPSLFILSDSLQKEKIRIWKEFWTPARFDSLHDRLMRHGSVLKFKSNSFDQFLTLLLKDFKPLHTKQRDSLAAKLLPDLVNKQNGHTNIVTLVKVANGGAVQLSQSFGEDKNIAVFDRQQITSQFVSAISSDFGFILLVTSLLVFGFMLLSHGRIELAIINFLPMFISWIWILGLMALFGLKFNIINIIISTFIFGLGDDYSIFIMDGLATEYKYGKKNLASFKISILLSALTNIIGIGVLIFAKHPALKSIAAITIIGLCTVLFISFVVQPLFYDFLILRRKQKGLLPLTASFFLLGTIGVSIFVSVCFLLTFSGLVTKYLLPLSRARRRLIFHYQMMYICRFVIYLFWRIKKEIVFSDKNTFEKPSVIVANHQSHIDLAILLMLHPKLIVFTNKRVWNSRVFGPIVRLAEFYPATAGYEGAIEKVKPLVDEGYSVLIFPEGTRSKTDEILRFHKGAFYLAQNLKLDIQPVVIHGTGDVLPKSDFFLSNGSLTVKFMDRIPYADNIDYQTLTKSCRQLIKSEYLQLKNEKEHVHYFRSRLIKNYIFKGPIVEWYTRIKTKLENDYQEAENLLPKDGKITDVGCGYGYLSLMLSFTSRDREIIGIDYDEEKIMLAQNCTSRSHKLNFIHADVTQYQFSPSNAFVINDVLHYLKHEQQVHLLCACAEKLLPGGIMIIRDGDADKTKRHRGTRYTEFFSTNFGFNKTAQGGLHFASANLISETLSRYSHLKFDLIDDTKYTSNITFVVRNTLKN